jgi:spoIIIJ-associated protein
MEWVETTGRTVEDAKEAALDQLGIDASEAEFEIVEEPRTGLFGRVRNDARIRARVKPKAPRPKQERRPRRTRGKKDATSDSTPERASEADSETTSDDSSGSPRAEGGRAPRRRRSNARTDATQNQEGSQMSDEVVTVDQQADIISEFLEGLLEAAGIPGTIDRSAVDDDTVELSVVSDSPELGLLIGPKGQTLTAVHELSRAVLQRRAPGRHEGRVRIDIGGYRRRRQEALARFVRQQADAVLESGVSRALEPMNAADRKIVHDTCNEIDGIGTLSEGVDPDRRVVIVPADASE